MLARPLLEQPSEDELSDAFLVVPEYPIEALSEYYNETALASAEFVVVPVDGDPGVTED